MCFLLPLDVSSSEKANEMSVQGRRTQVVQMRVSLGWKGSLHCSLSLSLSESVSHSSLELGVRKERLSQLRQMECSMEANRPVHEPKCAMKGRKDEVRGLSLLLSLLQMVITSAGDSSTSASDSGLI